jgi:m7GpppX diphosphatase
MENTINDSLIKEIMGNSTFKIVEVLDENVDKCSFSILCKIKKDEKEEFMVFKIMKKEFSKLSDVFKNFDLLFTNPIGIFNNDIYYKFLFTDMLENKLKVDFIYPADTRVIDKYRKKGHILITETPEMYFSKTKKFIDSIDPSHTNWIKKILYENAEELLYKDEDFIIVQDYNSKQNPDILNCLALTFNNDIKSIRDLNHNHLNLLEKLSNNGREVLAKKFKFTKNKIRAFVHYPPTFYYFHVHYLHVDLESSSITVNRAIDLNTIIQNIKIQSDYYQKVELEVTLLKGSKLDELLN